MSVRTLLRRLGRPLTAKLTRASLERFLTEHASTGRTLDLGASAGPYAARFPHRVALDIEAAPGIDLIADAHAIALRDCTFDVLLATEVLEHLRDPQRAADEMFRVLRPGGTLLLTTRFVFPLHDAPGDYYRYTRYGLEHLFRRFSIDEIREEADAMGTLAILLQRLGIQAETLGWRPLRFLWLALAQIVRRLSFLITREYGDARDRRTVQPMFTSGYYLVARRPAAGPPADRRPGTR
jgi:SAM-dependent methyltransferase